MPRGAGQAASHGMGSAPVTLKRVRDVDAYRGAVGGVDIEAVRAGGGRGPNVVMSVADDSVTVTACDIGFPILSRTTTGDDRVIISIMRSAPPGSRWCEIDLRPGQALAYGPAVEHSATNREGLGFTFVATSLEHLRARAERLGRSIRLPGRGEAQELGPVEASHAISGSLLAITARSTAERIPRMRLQELLDAMVLTFARTEERPRPRRNGRRLDSGRIVGACIEFALAVERVPAMHELCSVSKVSERRLRQAFITVYGLPPSTCLRTLMLDEAYRRLVLGVPTSTTVASIAVELGFDHLGRFAKHYRQIYGESPSRTLHDAHPTFVS